MNPNSGTPGCYRIGAQQPRGCPVFAKPSEEKAFLRSILGLEMTLFVPWDGGGTLSNTISLLHTADSVIISTR
jgi:hypothetical protein